MDSFEWNKVFAAILTLAFVVLGVNFLAEGIFSSKAPEKAGYAIEGAPVAVDTSGGNKGPVVEPVAALLATADVAKGQKVAKKCVACHSVDEGGKNKVGPALYGVVNRAIGGVDGFGYSTALKAYAADKTWTYEELNGFIAKPKAHIKGTSMGFAGVKKTDDRAALIAYLRTLAATPAPLPEG